MMLCLLYLDSSSTHLDACLGCEWMLDRYSLFNVMIYKKWEAFGLNINVMKYEVIDE